MSELDWRMRGLRACIRAVPRGRYRLLEALAPTRGRVIARLAADLGAARFEADLADALSREVCFTGIYEPPITRVFQRHLSRGGRIIDAGANWGYFSLIAAAACGPGGSVIALEPDPRHAEALTRNLALNAFNQVRLLQAAAAATAGTVTLTGYDEADANRGVSRLTDSATPTGARRSFDVPATTIDAIARSTSVDVVKIDVEGAEDLVLEGMRDGLAAKRYRAILLELHPALLRERGTEPDQCIRRLVAAGYHGWTIDTSPQAYRLAIDPAVDPASLLLPIEAWRQSPWPHLLWLC